MRITGLATGMDIDELVKTQMKPYRIKIQQKQQQKEILEIKQQLYRDVINDSREFYNKYFDVSKKDSILLSKNWSTVKFTSSNENVVTVTSGSDAKASNYTITGTVATAAKTVVTQDMIKNNKIVVNGKEFELKGTATKEQADNLNKELKTAGINISVRYSDFAGTEAGNKSGFVFESTVLGTKGNFTIGGTATAVGTKVLGVDATAATITSNSFTVDNLRTNGISINGMPITLDIKDVKEYSEIEKTLNGKLKDKNLSAKIDDKGNITFSSTVLGSKVEDPKIAIGSDIGTFVPGIDATYTTNTMNFDDIKGKIITVNGNSIDMSKATASEKLQYLQDAISKQNINLKVALDGTDPSKLVFTSNTLGEKGAADINVIDIAAAGFINSTPGVDAEITFKDNKGGVYKHVGNSNSVTLDGITFNFNDKIPDSGVTITGKNDTTAVKDMVVGFVNDYNKLMEKLNTLTMEKHNRNYSPLTDEQKKEMSEDEIKLWNEKVKKGQLYKDSDVSRIANSMKEAMRGLVDGVSGNLEKFGIAPVADYQGTKHGTFTIDEDKLTNALGNNLEDVMKLFTATPPNDPTLSEAEKNRKSGLGEKLKDILYKETVTVSSSIIKKAGVLGTASAANSEITKSITEYERKMKDMETDFSRREQLLYSKWANIETMMNNLNSQQSYLTSQLGM